MSAAAAADAPVAKAKPQPKSSGVSAIDEAFAKIRADRQKARDELKGLRKQYKKELGCQIFLFFVFETKKFETRQLCFAFETKQLKRNSSFFVCSPLQEDARRRRLKAKRQNLTQTDVQHIAEMMGMTAAVKADANDAPADEE